MTLPTPIPPVPAAIPRLSVALTDRIAIGEQAQSQAANYELVVWDQNNNKYPYNHESGNVVPHITTDERDWLMAFMTSLRARAEAAILAI